MLIIKINKNKINNICTGRQFYSCPMRGKVECKFFKWADEKASSSSDQTEKPTKEQEVVSNNNKEQNLSILTPAIVNHLKRQRIPLYANCTLVRTYGYILDLIFLFFLLCVPNLINFIRF